MTTTLTTLTTTNAKDNESTRSSTSSIKGLLEEYRAIGDARRAVRAMSLAARDEMECISARATERLRDLATEAKEMMMVAKRRRSSRENEEEEKVFVFHHRQSKLGGAWNGTTNVPMTIPRGAFRRFEESTPLDEEEEEEALRMPPPGDEHRRRGETDEDRNGGVSSRREDWWFNVQAQPLTPEQVLESFDVTENKEDVSEPLSGPSTKKTSTPFFASPTYSFEKQFEDALRFLGSMELRTFKEQLVESKIDAVICEASASALANLSNGSPSRAAAWQTRVDVACETLENAGADAASEALMAKARALAAEVLKRAS